MQPFYQNHGIGKGLVRECFLLPVVFKKRENREKIKDKKTGRDAVAASLPVFSGDIYLRSGDCY